MKKLNAILLCLLLTSIPCYSQEEAPQTEKTVETSPEAKPTVEASREPSQEEKKEEPKKAEETKVEKPAETPKEEAKKDEVAETKKPQMATVTIIRGDAFKKGKGEKEVKLEKDNQVEVGETVFTKEKSFLRLKMEDETLLSLGPNSELVVNEFIVRPKRKVDIVHLKGKVRAHIQRKSVDGESWKLNTKIVSVGVRGTEFLSSAYQAGGKSVGDVALIKGKVTADVAKTGAKVNSLNMSPGQYFNTTELASKPGLQGLKTMSPEALEKLAANSEQFIPNIQNPDGSFIDFEKSLRSQLGLPDLPKVTAPAVVPVVVPVPVVATKEKKEEPKAIGVVKEGSRLIIKDEKHKHLKDQPWDIRDAMMRAKNLRRQEDSSCFVWFYKRLPGSGSLERFRRERDCNEFDY